MKKSVKSTLVLVAICAVTAILLALTNAITAPIIKANQDKAANEALKAKWLVNRADEDVTVTDTGDAGNTGDTTDTDVTETTAPDTTPPTTETPDVTKPSEKGCGSSLPAMGLLPVLAGGWLTLRRRKKASER